MDKVNFGWYTLTVACVIVGLTVSVDQCDPNTCTLPACYCAKAGTPGGMPTPSIPQMVLFMFDGAVTERDLPYYEDLFTITHLNPNGCPIGATAFVSNNFTDYRTVRKLYLKGMEIGVRSVTSRTPPDWWKNADVKDMEFEILQQKANLEREAGIPTDDIRGWRSPGLQSSGSSQYSVLLSNNFEYDSTVVPQGWSGNSSIPGWPFTLDHPYPDKCQIQPCPAGSYPGLWEVPVVAIADIAGQYPCSYLGGCSVNPPKDKAQVLANLRKNFEANYKNSRAPVYFNLRTAWLMAQSYHRDGLLEFLKELVAMDDVYIITARQLLAWVKDPQTVVQAKDFTPWSCPNFDNNNIGIWDHIQMYFKSGRENVVIPIEPMMTPRPTRVNRIYYVDNDAVALKIDISAMMIGLTYALMTYFLL